MGMTAQRALIRLLEEYCLDKHTQRAIYSECTLTFLTSDRLRLLLRNIQVEDRRDHHGQDGHLLTLLPSDVTSNLKVHR